MQTLNTTQVQQVSGGVTFESRHDNGLNGKHTGWCKGLGHPESQGLGKASGHRNHEHCCEFGDCFPGGGV